MARDGRSKLADPERVRVAEGVAADERGLSGFDHAARRSGRGLPDFEVQNVAAGCLPFLGGAHDLHDVEGRDLGSLACS
ncbi:MAG: hypothetical protein ACE5EV_00795 [Gaiellales bacterium]